MAQRGNAEARAIAALRAQLASLLRKATAEHSASMSQLQQQAEDESLEVGAAARLVRDAHASVLQRQRAEIEQLREENAALRGELSAPSQGRVQGKAEREG